MTRNEGQKIADDFHKKHRSLKNNGHKIIVIDYPHDYNRELAGQNIKGFHRASDNDTYIIASEHESKEDLLKTIKHETYGHYGLNTFSQENKIDILLSVVHLQDVALKDEWQQVRYDYPDMKEFRQAEEVFCSVVSEVTSKPEFQHSFSDALESKKEIQDVGKYIKMTLQTGDAKQLIVPENNNLQFSKYIYSELGMKKEDNKAIHGDEITQEGDISLSVFQDLTIDYKISEDTRNKIVAYAKIMEDDKLESDASNLDVYVMKGLGNYFKYLNSSDYMEYERFKGRLYIDNLLGDKLSREEKRVDNDMVRRENS